MFFSVVESEWLDGQGKVRKETETVNKLRLGKWLRSYMAFFFLNIFMAIENVFYCHRKYWQ